MESKRKKIFCENLKHYMEINKKSRKDICNDLGIKYTTICDWVNCKNYPRQDMIDVLSNYFHINSALLTEEHEKLQEVGKSFYKTTDGKFHIQPLPKNLMGAITGDVNIGLANKVIEGSLKRQQLIEEAYNLDDDKIDKVLTFIGMIK